LLTFLESKESKENTKNTVYNLAPPPYESLTNDSTNTPAQLQHQYNRIMENQLNNMLQTRSDSPSLANTVHRTSGEFVIVPPPSGLNYPETLHNVD
jgi:hypothetical protein